MKTALPLVALSALLFAGAAWPQPKVIREVKLGDGRITEVATPANGKALSAGQFAIAEWKENMEMDGKLYPYTFRDLDGNWWFILYKDRLESFAGHPSSLDGSLLHTSHGCTRFVTGDGSYFTGAKGLKTVEKSFTPAPSPMR
jgi:hypothetical protein